MFQKKLAWAFIAVAVVVVAFVSWFFLDGFHPWDDDVCYGVCIAAAVYGLVTAGKHSAVWLGIVSVFMIFFTPVYWFLFFLVGFSINGVN